MNDSTLSPTMAGDSAADAAFASHEGRSQFVRATLSCWLGTAMEYVDFALYGLAAGGEDGVVEVVRLLQAEIDRTQALMGLPDLSDRPTA